MPEITSVETVRAKLREFDAQVEGAIAAATALARIRAQAENLLKGIEGISAKAGQSAQNAEDIRNQLEQLEQEWDELKKRFELVQSESKDMQELVLSEIGSAISSLDQKLDAAEERLRSANKASLAEQSALLTRLDASTRANAEIAADAKSVVIEQAEQLGKLLDTLRDDLHGELLTQYSRSSELLESRLNGIQNELNTRVLALTQSLNDQAGNQERVLRNEISSFKEEMKRGLAEHQRLFDRQLTDFLNKQNALIQNLTQQIDGYQRVSNVITLDLQATKEQVKDLATSLGSHRMATEKELGLLSVGLAGSHTLLRDLRNGLNSEGQSRATVGAELREIADRLAETIHKLKDLPFIGGKFK